MAVYTWVGSFKTVWKSCLCGWSSNEDDQLACCWCILQMTELLCRAIHFSQKGILHTLSCLVGSKPRYECWTARMEQGIFTVIRIFTYSCFQSYVLLSFLGCGSSESESLCISVDTPSGDPSFSALGQIS